MNESYKVAGIDVHKNMLAVVITDVAVEGDMSFERTVHPTLRELIERVSARPDALVGSLVNSYALPSDVGEILAGIQGFSYEVRRGHFYFECKGISGFAAYPCDSVEFAEFERFVREQRPSKFVQVHEILRRTP